MFATILGQRWRIRFVAMRRNDGECDAPQTTDKEIRIASHLKGERRLSTIIHEALHASAWHIDEEFVDQFGNDLARLLTRLGYREEP